MLEFLIEAGQLFALAWGIILTLMIFLWLAMMIVAGLLAVFYGIASVFEFWTKPGKI